ncbi:MAG: hypothetical protein JXM70_00550 [Pirellulales bacterium]|nr:hypothetical protein [Pirellulales bacterium]
MEELYKQVQRAKSRLVMQRFVSALGWCLVVTFSIAAVLILVGKFWPLVISDGTWGLAALVLGVLAAAVWSLATARGGIDAAMEIDRRFGLKERVSSTLALSEEERQTEIGQALVEDAVRRVKRVDVGEEIKVRPSRRLLYPLIPALVAFCIAAFVSPAVAEKTESNEAEKAAIKKQVKQSAKTLQKKLEKKRLMAKQKGLKEAEDVFKLLEQGARNMSDKSEADQKKAMMKLNDLSKELNKRRQKQGGAEQIKKQLGDLKGFKQGPADQFAKAIRRGDFKKAMDELDKLKEQLKAGELDKKQQEQLAQQLDQMRKKVQQMAEKQKATQKELQKKIDKLRKDGKAQEANKLEEQLDKLRRQMPQMDQLEKMAQKMQKCSKCLKDGDMKDAAEALEGAQKSLEGLKKELDELEMLDEAMDQLEQCRKSMCCKNCQGAGCKMCQGEGDKPGDGMGEGAGKGDRPEEEHDTKFRDSKDKVKVGKGSMTIEGFVDGPNKKGEVGEEIKQQLEAAKRRDTDPLTGQRIPRKHRESVNGYFSGLRGERNN